MARTGLSLVMLLMFAAITAASAAGAGAARTLQARSYLATPLGATKPLGWMKSQLDAQDAGLCGNKYLGGGAHANVSKWVGGKGYNGLAESYVCAWTKSSALLGARVRDCVAPNHTVLL